MEQERSTKADDHLLAVYVNGFLGSVFLTIAAYLVVVQHMLSRRLIIALIIAMALVQCIVQMVCFLHLGTESKPRWKLMMFWFMILVVIIIVFGSLWIMNNLNYNMDTSHVNKYLNSQDGL